MCMCPWRNMTQCTAEDHTHTVPKVLIKWELTLNGPERFCLCKICKLLELLADFRDSKVVAIFTIPGQVVYVTMWITSGAMSAVSARLGGLVSNNKPIQREC